MWCEFSSVSDHQYYFACLMTLIVNSFVCCLKMDLIDTISIFCSFTLHIFLILTRQLIHNRDIFSIVWNVRKQLPSISLNKKYHYRASSVFWNFHSKTITKHIPNWNVLNRPHKWLKFNEQDLNLAKLSRSHSLPLSQLNPMLPGLITFDVCETCIAQCVQRTRHWYTVHCTQHSQVGIWATMQAVYESNRVGAMPCT